MSFEVLIGEIQPVVTVKYDQGIQDESILIAYFLRTPDKQISDGGNKIDNFLV